VQKANLQGKGKLDKAAYYRSVVMEIPDANNFKFGYIFTENGIRECDPDGITPTVRVVMPYDSFVKIMKKQLSIQDAIYYGLVGLQGENAFLHANILMLVFAGLVS
jgi:hypothetical protein